MGTLWKIQEHGNCTLCPGGWPSFATAFVKHKLISPVCSKSSEMQQVEMIWFDYGKDSGAEGSSGHSNSLLFFNMWLGNSSTGPGLSFQFVLMISLPPDLALTCQFGLNPTRIHQPLLKYWNCPCRQSFSYHVALIQVSVCVHSSCVRSWFGSKVLKLALKLCKFGLGKIWSKVGPAKEADPVQVICVTITLVSLE